MSRDETKYLNPAKENYYTNNFPEPENIITEEDAIKSIAISLRKISENLYEIARFGVNVYEN